MNREPMGYSPDKGNHALKVQNIQSTKLSKLSAILVFAVITGISYGTIGGKDFTNSVNSLMQDVGETPGISHIHLSK